MSAEKDPLVSRQQPLSSNSDNPIRRSLASSRSASNYDSESITKDQQRHDDNEVDDGVDHEYSPTLPGAPNEVLTEGPKLAVYGSCWAVLLILFIAGVLFLALGATWIQDIIEAKLPLTGTDSLLFQAWQDTHTKNIPIYRNFYVWHLENPYEVYNRSEVPRLTKIGPFVFSEHTYSPMDTIQWSADQTEISFHYYTDLQFVESMSIDPVRGQLFLNTTFTTLNLALYAAAYRIGQYVAPDALYDDFLVTGYCDLIGFPDITECVRKSTCGIMNDTITEVLDNDHGLFIQRNVSDFFFGFKDLLWSEIADLSAIMHYQNPSEFRILFNHSEPAPAPYTTGYGLTCPVWDNQSVCNSSATSVNRMYTGKGELSQIAQYSQWAGQDRFWWWGANHSTQNPVEGPWNAETEGCQTVRGSNGMNYPPGLTSSDTPYVFVDSLFRSIELQYQKDTTVKDIPTLEFRMSDNEIFSTTNNRTKNCYHQHRIPAVMNLTEPYFAPLIVSQPLFYGLPDMPNTYLNEEDDAPPAQKNKQSVFNFTVDGLPFNEFFQTMTEDDYSVLLRVEPHTGLLMQGFARIQFSTWLRPIRIEGCPGLFPDLLPNNETDALFPYSLLPVMYLDRTFIVTDDLAKEVKNMVVLPFLLVKILGGLLIGVSVVSVLLSVFMYRKRKQQWEAQKPYQFADSFSR